MTHIAFVLLLSPMAAFAIPSHPIPNLASRPRLEDFNCGLFSPPPPALYRAQSLILDGLTDPPGAAGLATANNHGRSLASRSGDQGSDPLIPHEEQESGGGCHVGQRARLPRNRKRPSPLLKSHHEEIILARSMSSRCFLP